MSFGFFSQQVFVCEVKGIFVYFYATAFYSDSTDLYVIINIKNVIIENKN